MHENHYAVVVGIDFYPGVKNLAFARKDATAFCKWLTDPDGGELPPANVRQIILSQGPFGTVDEAVPTRELVDRALKDVHTDVRKKLKANPTVWPETRLYMYFSGHGVSPGPDETAVLMANASDQDLGYNIACSAYMRYYQETQDFHELVFFADCCRSQRSDAPVSGPPFNKLVQSYGSVVKVMGFATQYRDLAYEPTLVDNPDEARGYYTMALLEALTNGVPDAGGEGVTATTLQNYVRKRVSELTKGKPYAQVPEMQADPGAVIQFRKPAPQKKRQVTITFPAGTPAVTLFGGVGLNELGQWDPASGPWGIPLEDGLYAVRHTGSTDGNGFANSGLFAVFGGDVNVSL
jgi:uncharacterized caspase-like protein